MTAPTSKSILVSGVAGFIGSHVAESLLRDGHRVVGVDNFDPYYDIALKHENLDAVRAAGDGRFAFIEADIRDASAMRGVFEAGPVGGVIHLAARAGVRPSIEDPVGYASVNIVGTSVLLDAAQRVGCDRFVMASSSSVYGNSTNVPFGETDDVSRPISPYASTKRACELIAHTHHHLTGMPTACLRFFTVFGERQRPDLAIRLFMNKVHAGDTISMFGDGSTSRDYTYVGDIVDGIRRSFDRVPEYGYRVWNLGGDHPVRLDAMIAMIGQTVGREPVIEQKPMQPGDVERTWADLEISRAELGYAPQTTFEEGLARLWSWLRDRDTVPAVTVRAGQRASSPNR